ncbi:MAG: hypothetical protein KDD56_10850, partial [Bdellovibrionales bacterium]|nr:hypothetical protein [Bdellovibrionales bacterium]
LVKVRIPRTVYILAVAGARCGFVASRANLTNFSSSFFVSRLSDDEFENESRIFRSMINDAMSLTSNSKAARFYAPLENQLEAVKLLKNNPEKIAVVWGSKRWLSISFRHKESQSLAQIGVNDKYISLNPYEVILSVPVVGLSYKPARDTALFIANLIEAQINLDASDAADNFKAAGSIYATWTSFSHRAYPWWQVGNINLLQGLKSDSYESGLINCAIDAYKYAARQLRYADNPELLSAITNNLAVAYMAKLSIEAKKEYKKLARKKFSAAKDISNRPNRYGIKLRAQRIAARNLKRLREENVFKGEGLKRKGKHLKATKAFKNKTKKQLR